MRLPNSYLISIGKVEAYFDAMLNAEAPDRFTAKFIENLGFTSSNDRLLTGVLKELGFLDEDGVPTSRYYEFLDRSQWHRVLAAGVREAYSDLFSVNTNANEMDVDEVTNKLRTLYAGAKTDLVISRIAKTFVALSEIADFSAPPKERKPEVAPKKEGEPKLEGRVERELPSPPIELKPVSMDSLQYHVNIVLPETRDQSVYDAIFRSLREHLG